MHLSLQDGYTALMKASARWQVECIKVLLDRGAEVNMQNKVSGVDVNPLCHQFNHMWLKCPIIIHVPLNGHYMCVPEYMY